MIVTISVLQFLIVFIYITCINAENDMPTVHDSWIFAMIVLGFIGSALLISLITIAIYKTRNAGLPNTIYTINIILTFTITILNTFACLEWAFLRTDLFIELNTTKCTVIYISNYLFYMIGKYTLHILLLYRLYLAFRGTVLRLNTRYLSSIAALITIDFIIFVGLWLNICLQKVSIGITVPSHALTFCTLYNNDSASEMTLYQKVWPMLFGAQDFIVGMLTLALFVYKLKQTARLGRDAQIEALMRKLVALGLVSIISTFMLFTFAVPFYSNLTFLLPFDALLNSVCVLLLLDWTKPLYLKLCCVMDACLQYVFDHHDRNRTSKVFSNVVLDGINLNVSTTPQSPVSPQSSNIPQSPVSVDVLTSVTVSQSS